MHDRSHLMTVDISKFRAYQKMIQEQVLHDNKWHDKHVPSLANIASSHEKSNKAVQTGCLYFGDHDEADDDAADVATADDVDDDDDDAGVSWKCEIPPAAIL